jgi:electron-transferring-flavoprotein dehydrogenase
MVSVFCRLNRPFDEARAPGKTGFRIIRRPAKKDDLDVNEEKHENGERPAVEIQREDFPVDVLIVGAGPAGLACAYHLRKLLQKHDETREKKLGETMVVVIEKAAAVGDHSISGAVMDPKAIEELVPDYRDRGCPVEKVVDEDHLLFLTEKGKFRSPWVPPILDNHGYAILSLNRFTKWLGEQCEAEGVNIFPGFPGRHLLFDDRGGVAGVVTGDKGIDKNGQPKANLEPGMNLRAKVTVFAEGARGSLTKMLAEKLDLQSETNPQIYATGVKEVWEMPEGRLSGGRVIHTMGWPLSSRQFGGGFIYNMDRNLLSLGFVAALDYERPWFDPHGAFCAWKRHPYVAGLLEGGKMVHYGAKAIPEGGYHSLFKSYGNGFLVIGDAGGYLNAMRLKGIHLAIKTGMMAAEAIYDALVAEDTSEAKLRTFRDRFESSWAHRELWKSRNFRQGFQGGMVAGMIHTGLQLVTGGRGFFDRRGTRPDHAHMKTLKELARRGITPPRHPAEFDKKLTFDKLTDIYYSGTIHEENQPAHLVVADFDICNDRCTKEYGNPCQHFCPASVYEMVENEETGRRELQVNFTNCVHCKTCDIMDPYEIITWVTPEGGGGPVYTHL